MLFFLQNPTQIPSLEAFIIIYVSAVTITKTKTLLFSTKFVSIVCVNYKII